MLPFTAGGGDLKLDVLRTRTVIYTNVTVYERSATDIFITHSRGFGNVKIKDLDNDTLRALGLSKTNLSASAISRTAKGKEVAKLSAKATNVVRSVMAKTQAQQLIKRTVPDMKSILAKLPVRMSSKVLVGLFHRHLGRLPVFLLLPETDLQTLGRKPVPSSGCQFCRCFPCCVPSGMSGWWFIAFLIPLLNIVALILWSAKIYRSVVQEQVADSVPASAGDKPAGASLSGILVWR